MTFQVNIQIECGTDLLVIVWHSFSHHASLVPFVQCNGTTDLPGPFNRLIYCLTQVSLVASSCYLIEPSRHTSWHDKITDLNYVAVKLLQVAPVNLSCQPPWQCMVVSFRAMLRLKTVLTDFGHADLRHMMGFANRRVWAPLKWGWCSESRPQFYFEQIVGRLVMSFKLLSWIGLWKMFSSWGCFAELLRTPV